MTETFLPKDTLNARVQQVFPASDAAFVNSPDLQAKQVHRTENGGLQWGLQQPSLRPSLGTLTNPLGSDLDFSVSAWQTLNPGSQRVRATALVGLNAFGLKQGTVGINMFDGNALRYNNTRLLATRDTWHLTEDSHHTTKNGYEIDARMNVEGSWYKGKVLSVGFSNLSIGKATTVAGVPCDTQLSMALEEGYVAKATAVARPTPLSWLAAQVTVGRSPDSTVAYGGALRISTGKQLCSSCVWSNEVEIGGAPAISTALRVTRPSLGMRSNYTVRVPLKSPGNIKFGVSCTVGDY